MALLTSATSKLTNLFSTTYGEDGKLSRKITQIGFIALTVVLLQIAFERYIFECPPYHYRQFSIVFFVGPIIPLFCVGWMSSVALRNALQGIFFKFWNPKMRQRNWKRVCCARLTVVIFKSNLIAFTAPFFWILMCLLHGQIIPCGMYGPTYLHNETNKEILSRWEAENLSKLVGCGMIILMMACASIFITVKTCFIDPKRGEEIVPFEMLDNYTSYEADAARRHLENIMKGVAEQNGRNKVNLLLQKYNPHINDGDLKNELEKEVLAAKLSFSDLIMIREALEEIYPKLDNKRDCRNLQLYTHETWKREKEVFRKQLSLLSPNSKTENNVESTNDDSTAGSLEVEKEKTKQPRVVGAVEDKVDNNETLPLLQFKRK